MRIFMTGADGQLGRALQAALAGHEVVATDRDTVDVSDYRALAAAIEQARPDAVAHLAALTDVDGCARDPDLALRINALGTRNVALACQDGERPLLYVSTNEVFDGQSRRPYYEWDPPRPINAYGYSKWAGEQSVKALSRCFYIVRTAWLYGPGGANFVHKVLAQARAGGRLRVVWDEVANPTYVPDLAAALAALLAGHARGAYGIYHLVNAGACSRYDFARRALDLSGLGEVPIEPLRQADYPRASRPPLYTALHNFVGTAGGLALRPWQEALAEFAQAVAAPSPDA